MSLTALVDPGSSLIQEITADLECEDPRSVDRIVQALCDRFGDWQFAARFGPTSYVELASERRGNCIDLATVFCASLLRLEVMPSYVVLGSWTGAFPALVHAWILTYSPWRSSWLLIDPRDMVCRPCEPDDIEEELTITALFNDKEIIVSAAGRSDLFSRPQAVKGVVMTESAQSGQPAGPARREPVTIEQQGEGFHAVLAGADGRVFITNDVGRAVLEMCDGAHIYASIVSALVATFEDTPQAQIESDIDEFLSLARDKGVLQWGI